MGGVHVFKIWEWEGETGRAEEALWCTMVLFPCPELLCLCDLLQLCKGEAVGDLCCLGLLLSLSACMHLILLGWLLVWCILRSLGLWEHWDASHDSRLCRARCPSYPGPAFWPEVVSCQAR